MTKGAAAGEDIGREGKTFWDALQATAPRLADEAKEYSTVLGLRATQERSGATSRAVEQSRNFFDLALEVQVREVAIRTGYVPSNVGELIHEDGGVHVLQPQQDLAATYEGLRSACTDQGFVVGTRTGSCRGSAFPRDGPLCFYSALFDKRGGV